MVGTKRTTSGKNSKGQPDFKRIKAKVGKRAPKAANVTDTSFKSASLHVRGQAVDHSSSTAEKDGHTTGGGLLLSTRGKSISELILQLNHPAYAVRLSAMKGLGNLVQSCSSSPATLRPHLSFLIPACGKSSVDEDEEVRQAGLKVLRELIHQQDESGLRPFVSLLVAYSASALNSLDSGMRLDGARAVELICTAIPNLVTSQQRIKLLPPYSGLVAERYKKSKHAEEVLQSLVAILSTGGYDIDNSRGHDWLSTKEQSFLADPDLVYVEDGRGSNTLLLEGSRNYSSSTSHPVRVLTGIEDLPTIEGLDQFAYDSSAFEEQKRGIPVALSLEILSQLRDSLIEATEQGGEEGTSSISASKPLNVENVVLLSQSIQLIWNQSAGRSKSDTKSLNFHGGDTVSSMYRLGHQIASLMLEVFPITLEDSKSNNRSRIRELNGLLSGAIMDISVVVDSDEKINESRSQLDWIGPLCSYLYECLQDWECIPSPTLGVMGGLLLLQGEDTSKGKTHRVDMIKRLHDTFFAPEENKEIARSSTGRKIFLSVAAMAEQEMANIVEEQTENPIASVLILTIIRLPTYLTAWRGDFVCESRAVIDLLHNVSRRINKKDHSILKSLRATLSCVVDGKSTKSNKKSKGKSTNRSILEEFPPSLQRKFVGLLIMIESPSEKTLAGLANICGRCNMAEGPTISSATADFIVESLHTIRKTLSMQSYMSFLVSSTGLHRKLQTTRKFDETKLDARSLVQMDVGIRRICRALVQCGPSFKVLHMILPVLSEWLDSQSAKDPSPSPTDFSLRARAAISIICMLVLDLRRDDPSVHVFAILPQLERPIIAAYARMITFPVIAERRDNGHLDGWMCPLVALCQCEPTMCLKLCKFVALSIKDGTLYDPVARKSTLESLIGLVMDKRMIHCVGSDLIAAARLIDETLGNDSPARQLSSRFVNLLELKCGTI